MKRKPAVWAISLLAICLLIFSFRNGILAKTSYTPEKGFVPDEATAIKIAEAVWYPIYGNGINDKKPFIATLKNDSTCVVEGSLPLLSKGGVPYIEINKYDCRVLKVMHGK